MTNISHLFLPSFLKYEINEGRHILQAELLLTEAPEFRLGLVKRGMVQGISSTSIVAKPDVKPLLEEYHWQSRFVFRRDIEPRN